MCSNVFLSSEKNPGLFITVLNTLSHYLLCFENSVDMCMNDIVLSTDFEHGEEPARFENLL